LRLTSKEAAYISVSAALIYIGTSIAIPMPKPLGVWHFGDIFTFIVCVLFGPIVGGFASGIGPMLFDVWNPLWGSVFIVYAPATLVIRGIMGVILGSLRTVFRRHVYVSEVFAMAVAVSVKNFGYFFYDYYLYGAVAFLDLVTFFPMSALFVAITIPILATVRKVLGIQYLIQPSAKKGD